MWDLLGALGLLASAGSALGLVAAVLIQRSLKWAAAIALVGLTAFVASLVAEAYWGAAGRNASLAAFVTFDGRTTTEASPVPGVVRCGQWLPPNGPATSAFRDGALLYSLFAPKVYRGTAPDGHTQAGWVTMELLNDTDGEVISNPWIDFWLMWQPVAPGVLFSAQPLRVDLLEITGPTAVPPGSRVSIEPRAACLLLLTFRLDAGAELASVGVGYIPVFNIDLRR